MISGLPDRKKTSFQSFRHVSKLLVVTTGVKYAANSTASLFRDLPHIVPNYVRINQVSKEIYEKMSLVMTVSA